MLSEILKTVREWREVHEKQGLNKEGKYSEEVCRIELARANTLRGVENLLQERSEWIDFRRQRPDHLQIVDLVWRREGEQEIFRCRAQYRLTEHYPGLLGYVGTHFYLLEHAHRYPETIPILIPETAEFILWQSLPAEPAAEQIAAASAPLST